MKSAVIDNSRLRALSMIRYWSCLITLAAGTTVLTIDTSLTAQEAPAIEPAENQSPGKTEPGSDSTSGQDADPAEEPNSTGNGGAKPKSGTPGRARRGDISRSSSQFLKVFEPIAEQVQMATVSVKSGDKSVALGAIVDSGGFVLTKQSELQSPLFCELGDGRTVSAYVYGVHAATDLALLKIEASAVPEINWSEESPLGIGNWVVTVRNGSQSPVVGVVGVIERRIRPRPGFMGVNLIQQEDQVVVTNVNSDTPASRAGIQAGDVVMAINGEPFNEISAVIAKVQSFPPGDEITLTLLRDEKEIVLDIVLGDAESLNPLFERANQQNTMGGNILSKRRQDFPLAVQHDTLLRPQECGGPVLNIDGDVVGINIARQGRVSSLMLPTSLVKPIVNELKSGQLAPAVVHQKEIDEINHALQELKTLVNLSPVNNDSSKEMLKQLRDEEKEARTNVDEALKDLEAARETRIRAQVGMEDATQSYEKAKKEIERLERDLERLVSGTR